MAQLANQTVFGELQPVGGAHTEIPPAVTEYITIFSDLPMQGLDVRAIFREGMGLSQAAWEFASDQSVKVLS
jgi:hypothetical protein